MSEELDRFDPNFWKAWQNDDFKIFHQKDWIVIEPALPIIKYQISVPEDFYYFATANVIIDIRNDDLSNNEYLDSIKNNLPKMILGFDNYSVDENTDEHITYYKINYTSKQEGIDLHHEQYIWLICDKAYSLSFVYELDAIDEFKKTKNLIFNTFKIK